MSLTRHCLDFRPHPNHGIDEETKSHNTNYNSHTTAKTQTKPTSSLFLGKMTAQLERTLSTAFQNKDQIQKKTQTMGASINKNQQLTDTRGP